MRRCGLLLWLSALLLAPAFAANSNLSLAPGISWNPAVQGEFVTALCRDTQGNVWAGTEDQGVSCYSQAAKKWKQFRTADGLGDDSAYTLACDWKRRIWAGTLNHGVSVFNGKAWKNYDPICGPLGSHVTALAVCPTDGDIWMATEAGLARYSLNRNVWTYYTRADGLPSDQAQALAFDKDGTLYVGTQCDGLAVGSPGDDYKSWRTAAASSAILHTPTGDGLPSPLINAVLVMHSGTIWVGTPTGLASSLDRGKTWHYLRGEDWTDKTQGAANTLPPKDNSPGGPRLLEDYVTCLAEGTAGQLVVGHRSKGYEVLSPETGARLWSSGATATDAKTPAKETPAKENPAPDYVTALLAAKGQPGLVGTYGQGLLSSGEASSAPSAALANVAELPAFPTPAPPPSLVELKALLAKVKAAPALPVGGAAYLGQDWGAQGDWVGRYGRQYAVLCAAASPRDHYIVDGSRKFIIRTREYYTIGGTSYSVYAETGPHCPADEGLRHWLHWITTDNPHTLYNPLLGVRRETEWDDHGEAYPAAKEGPDVWLTVKVPAGMHRLSLYFFNPNGHDGSMRSRDYLVAIKPFAPTMIDAEALPDLARARVRDFCGGVYHQFALRGPAQYRVRVSRANSFNTIVNGIFLDRLPDSGDGVPPPATLPETGGGTKAETLAAAQALWAALDSANAVQACLPFQHTFRLFAYRAASEAGAPDALLTQWRTTLLLWTPADHQAFGEAMTQAWQTHLKTKYTADKPFFTRSK